MSSVTCCVDQNIIRFLLQTTFNDCFQIFILNLKFLKGKVIHINDKFIISVFDLCDHIVQILELMLVHLNNSKSLIIITVQDSFDTWRFTCTRITKQQTVVCFSASYKGFCILNEFLFRNFIAYQIFQFNMSDSCNRLNLYIIILIMSYTKRLM